MKPEPERFRPEPDTAENRARLAEQRERIRQALLTRNGACPICETPRARWPMIHRGCQACSIQCQKTLQAQGVEGAA